MILFFVVDFFFYFGLNDLSIGESGILKAPTITVLAFICDFMSNTVCFMKLGVYMFGAFMLTIVISF